MGWTLGNRRNGSALSSSDEQPLRAELFSVDQLEQHAKALAGQHEVVEGKGPDRLLPRLAENEAVLLRAYELVTTAVEKGMRIAPAAEWLIDNFYLIEEQIRTARRHLPKGYSRELPRLKSGPQAGFPRVYHIALELIAHVDGRIDAESLSSFIASYQTIQTLKLGELWAIPIMLRLALIENLRRVGARVVAGRTDRNAANEWADKLIETAEKDPKSVILVLADMVRAEPNLSSAFVAEMARRLQGQSPSLSLPLTWIEQRLGEVGQTLEQMVQIEGQHQAADQVSIGNSIGSLRFLGAMDWREFVETHSAVEQALRGDPVDIYADCDFATRDRYRHVVEETAKRSDLTEEQVAHTAVQLAREHYATDGEENRRAHVGYWLVDEGLRQLQRRCRMRPSLGQLLERAGRRFPLTGFLGTILSLTVLLVALVLWVGGNLGIGPLGLTVLGVLAVVCLSQLAVSLVNWGVTLVVAPKMLPRLDYSHGIPPESRTIVVIPTLLTDQAGVEELLENLEIHYLANRDGMLHFALLTDFPDAPAQTMPTDEALLQAARQGVLDLNARYASERTDAFFLFHRPRKWNESEGVWMGYERKRGKLDEFTQLLRGGSKNKFSLIVGDTSILPSVQYVITLDTDTQLPRDSARLLVGTMAHPLNRPEIDPVRRRVVRGYGILQPRVAVSLPSASRSWFARLMAGEPGIDPYTRAVSDVYQDVFFEGSFIGKGIFDVDAFLQTVSDRFPENAILSHDLLESTLARSGLVSDVQLYEDHPSRYPADVSRRHRWIRGDWQIAPWLLPRVPGPDGQAVPNPISALSWWKIFDNLRRSLVPPALLGLLLVGWVALPGGWVWTLVAISVVLVPPLLTILVDLFRKPEELPWSMHLSAWGVSAARQMAQGLMSLVFLPHEAFVNTDAIARTAVRMLITRRKMLEWRTASDAERNARTDLAGFHVSMWFPPTVAILSAGIMLALGRHPALISACPLLVLWLVSPTLAWWISRPIKPKTARLSESDEAFLSRLSRRTWRFFEVFVTPADNHLPPDNYQEHPLEVVAHRTSPTNIGMALLCNLSAYDFGYISGETLVDRCSKTLDTMGRMERYRGHFYNWYDTRTLQPLNPLYISTVDSGNLVGHLLTLRAGLLELREAPILPLRVFSGLADTIQVILEVGRQGTRIGTELRPGQLSGEQAGRLNRLLGEVQSPPRTLSASYMMLQRVMLTVGEVATAVSASGDDELKWWTRALERQTRDILDDLVRLAPWVAQAAPTEPMWRRGSGDQLQRLARLRELLRALDNIPTLDQVARLNEVLGPMIDAVIAGVRDPSGSGTGEDDRWFTELRHSVDQAIQAAQQRLSRLETLAQQCQRFSDMDWHFLFDPSRDLLAIGYNVQDRRMDSSFYDLLASEARLISYVAIAQGQLPQEHWFALGRLLTNAGGEPALVSWSGSMFEYLMPLLVMPNYPGTLLDQTYQAVVRRQIEYGQQRGVPWGVSESGYHTTDVHLNYQYRAFGVPGLGLKRGLGEDIVIAPYASVMALMVAPTQALDNLRQLEAQGHLSRYGFYEAVDYTPARLPRGQDFAQVRSFMAHHQGMSLLSLAYLLLDKPMQRRFESDPMLKSVELLLQERVPRSAPIQPHASEVEFVQRPVGESGESFMRVFSTPHTPIPEVHLLSNGRYHVMVTNSGAGYSRWRDLAVTRWHEDATLDRHGTFIYIRDTATGEFWSTAFQPTHRLGSHYEAIFPQARAEFRRRDGDIDTHTEISVSPEDDIELRRITLTNRGKTARTLELTSYAEVVLAPPQQDAAHPAFSNLFVQTQLVRHRHAILCTRRPRSARENPPWMLHLMSIDKPGAGESSFETDRSAFVGRGRTLANPSAMYGGTSLGNTEGSVLDPIVSVRRTVTIEPDESVRIHVVLGVAETRDTAVALIEKYHDRRLCDRVFELAWTHSQVVLRQLNATEADAQVYGRLAGAIIYAHHLRRSGQSVLARNRRGQSGLWGYGISGDLPIVLLRISDLTKIDLARQVIQAHAYWRTKGLITDLVIWNEDPSGYRQQLHDSILGLVAAGTEAQMLDRPGGVFVRRAEQVGEEDRTLFLTVARVVLSDAGGTLSEQIDRRTRTEPQVPRLVSSRTRKPDPSNVPDLVRRDLLFFNGFGGFTRDGREYIITTSPGRVTPAPWCNVIANPQLGTVVSESGGAYTWFENAHEFRLTPWYNDPVSDTSGEALYVRDDETGRFFSPTPLPARGLAPYTTRHGFGYSVFEYAEGGISVETWMYVSVEAPVKFIVVKLRNTSGRIRRMSVTGYFEWVLGELRSRMAPFVVTETDPRTGALVARNAYNSEFADRVAFVDASETSRTMTGDRVEFIGRNGSLANPAAMARTRLSGKVGAGLDPCAAVQCPVELADGEEKEIVFTIGAARGLDEARRLIQRFRGPSAARRELEAVWGYWNRTLGTVYVESPDPAVNVLVNGWLVYQVLACRYWARSGYYQSGGAYGFRDQLQDTMALLHCEPRLLREHLLRSASRQFREGDVQHWWHPPQGRGVRTHFSDDYLWLPLATVRYVLGTGDTGVLDEKVHFLEGRPVKPDEEAYYDLPARSDEIATLYEHCLRAIKHRLKSYGEHGLPTIGCGDWNDGMNLVGEHGRGESVWLGFFFYEVLLGFATLARHRKDETTAELCWSEADKLRLNIEQHAWDGEWYLRAYFDNGEPLGSARNPECQIDSLPQSWAVLSDAGDKARREKAMRAVDRRLVRRDARLIQLFDPPFDKSHLNPGYIKGYVPGVRENGGQYTHAAIWTIMAFATLGDRDKAWELFNLINPVHHGSSAGGIARYKVEPYVVAADVYAVPPHTGRGGWTWYTGSAGWMYRLILESLLGLRLLVDKLVFNPRIPAEWKQYRLHYRFRETHYRITFHNPSNGRKVVRVMVDGMEQPDLAIHLVDDRRDHLAEVFLE